MMSARPPGRPGVPCVIRWQQHTTYFMPMSYYQPQTCTRDAPVAHFQLWTQLEPHEPKNLSIITRSLLVPELPKQDCVRGLQMLKKKYWVAGSIAARLAVVSSPPGHKARETPT
eukprot:352502-Chlamydomonas_euryale.AAC.3